MASESTLQQLFTLAKTSLYFEGLGEKEIWNACLKYKDRSDEDIQIAMENIRNQDEKIRQDSNEKQSLLSENKQKMVELRQNEAQDRAEDERGAEDILDDLFNL